MKFSKKLKHVTLGLAVTLGLLTIPSLSTQASSQYTVQSGDSLWTISQKYNTSLNSIVTSNPGKLSSINSTIFPNETLTINETSVTYTPSTTYQQTYKQPTTTYQAPKTSTNNQVNSQASTSANTNSSYTGNSSISSVASEMEARTGVSASEWSQIIQRESNGQVGVTNSSSGAHGLFQSMHNPGNTVQSQINDAVNIYHQQGLSAWQATR